MLFHVLKNGCRVEALKLASLEKIERALTLFMVVSWRIARLMRLVRSCPALPASLRFDPDEIRAAHVLTNKPMPKELPSLNDRVRRVAMLGGFLARKDDGEPGVKTLWTGLQRVTDFAAGVRFMRLSGDTLGCMSWDALNQPAQKPVQPAPNPGERNEQNLACSRNCRHHDFRLGSGHGYRGANLQRFTAAGRAKAR